MEQTFMTIHNLSPDATILFASESIADILGYPPAEVQGKSCFDYFHPAEVPFARSVHSRGILLDKAAVLHYCRILSSDGRWIGCECCFTIVHDVLVACTSIYRRGAKSERRAIEAPQIRRIFACSPHDPRYHMLEHLSPKFKMSPGEREPRAALILNRFTRNLTVMFATNAISTIIGLEPHQIKNKSFYKCIQESCLPEAIRYLESAKENDSIAYLRFYFRDPREDDEFDDAAENGNDVDLDGDGDGDDENPTRTCPEQDLRRDTVDAAMDVDMDGGIGVNAADNGAVVIKIEEDDKIVSLSDRDVATTGSQSPGRARRSRRLPSIELEAVVSCTSDGLVVVLRKARPPIPPAHPPLISYDYGNGIFAAPWGQNPPQPRAAPPESLYTFRPPLLPQYMPLRENVKDAGGPPMDVLMGSIRDVAVFAWGLVGINPAMAAYGRGSPSGEARPTSSEYGGWQQQPAQHPDQHQEGVGSEAAAGDAASESLPLWPPAQAGTGKGKAPESLLAPRRHPSSSSIDGAFSQPGLPAAPSQGSCAFQSSWGVPGTYASGASADALQAMPTVPFGSSLNQHQQHHQQYPGYQQSQAYRHPQQQQQAAFAFDGSLEAPSRLPRLSSEEPYPLPVHGLQPHPSSSMHRPVFGWP